MSEPVHADDKTSALVAVAPMRNPNPEQKTLAAAWGIELNEWYDTESVQELLGVSDVSVRGMYARSELIGIKSGGKLKCRGHELLRAIGNMVTDQTDE